MGEVCAGLSDTCKWKWDPTWKTNALESGAGRKRRGGEERRGGEKTLPTVAWSSLPPCRLGCSRFSETSSGDSEGARQWRKGSSSLDPGVSQKPPALPPAPTLLDAGASPSQEPLLPHPPWLPLHPPSSLAYFQGPLPLPSLPTRSCSCRMLPPLPPHRRTHPGSATLSFLVGYSRGSLCSQPNSRHLLAPSARQPTKVEKGKANNKSCSPPSPVLVHV